MDKNRVEAFSDGVIAILITIMVLEIKTPHGTGLSALQPLLHVFVSYALSFVFIGIYWNNHHHLFKAAECVTGGILWANLHLLFWLSLVPFSTSWIGEAGLLAAPVAFYGFLLLMAGVAYFILSHALIAQPDCNPLLAKALGKDWKGKASVGIYTIGILLAFVQPWISYGLYGLVAFMWLVPDKRIEKILNEL